MPLFFGGNGVLPSLGGLASNVLTLNAGQCWEIPSGWFEVKTGKYTTIQEYDPITGIWRTIGGGKTDGSLDRVHSDGINYRLANQTGCAVGALLTVAGSGYVSPPTVTPSAGNSLWRAIVGGAVATAITIANGGSGYTYPPTVIFSPPPFPGVQATGYASISGGAVTGVTVTDQGAGYTSPPTITFIGDQREGSNNITTGINASAVATLTGAGTVTAVLCIDHGTPVGALPTLSFSGGGGSLAAATAIMCWTMTAFAVTSGGAGYTNPAYVVAASPFPATASAYINPTTQRDLVKTRNAQFLATQTAGAIVVGTQTLQDGGIFTGVPTPTTVGGAPTTAAVLTGTIGGTPDVSVVLAT